jgi:hypothetical protein
MIQIKSRCGTRRIEFGVFSREHYPMAIGSIVFLCLTVAGFVAFGIALAYAEWTSG